MQTSSFSLKIALMEEFEEGSVMKALHRLCEEVQQVHNFEESFNMVWRVYARFSFFRDYSLMFLKSQLLESLDQVFLEQVKPKSVQEMVKDARGMVLCAHEEGDAFEKPCKLIEDSQVDSQSKELGYDTSCDKVSCSLGKDIDRYDDSIDEGSIVIGEP